MYIKGVGMTNFGFIDKPTHLIAYDAIADALDDADMSMNEIDAVVITSLEWFYTGERQRHISSLLSSLLKTRKPIIPVPAACAGGGAALWVANKLAKKYNNVLAVGAEKLIAGDSQYTTDEFMMAAESLWEQPEGLIFPAQNALVAQEYMLKYPDTTTDDLALISFKNHSNGSLNPKAKFYGKKITLEEIKSSPVVVSPLRLFDCSISVDGGAAAIISSDKTDIEIAASALSTDYLPTFEREDNTSWDATVSAAKAAYSKAGLEPSDIDFAEVHDAFTSVELIAYEDLGFAKPGQGAKLIRDGVVNLDGKLPINACGGLKSKGHPVSATGLSHIYEIVKQMRNECGDRQLSRANVALAQNVGGAGGTVVTHILKKIRS